jgi:hypothetical protein
MVRNDRSWWWLRLQRGSLLLPSTLIMLSVLLGAASPRKPSPRPVKKPGTKAAASAEVPLTSLRLIEESAYHELATATFDGQTYAKALKMRGHLDFYLGKRYARFRALVGANDLAQGAFAATYIVKGDGTELYRSPVLRVGSEPQPVDLDIRGVLRLRLEAKLQEGAGGPNRAFWVNPRVYRGEDVPKPTVARILLDGNPLVAQAPIVNGEPCLPLSVLQRLKRPLQKVAWDPERGVLVIETQ